MPALLDEELRDGKAEHWRRVVIEKPFGHSVDSARELNTRITREPREEQIFRIDHFLGKETVQNIMAFRFANGLFEPSGTATGSTTCRSPWPRRSASSIAAGSTK